MGTGSGLAVFGVVRGKWWNGIEAAASERVAAEQPPQSEAAAAQEAVAMERSIGVVGTAGKETAACGYGAQQAAESVEQGGEEALVDQQGESEGGRFLWGLSMLRVLNFLLGLLGLRVLRILRQVIGGSRWRGHRAFLLREPSA